VGGGDVDFAGAVFLKDFGGLGDGVAGGDHVIDHEDGFAFDFADDIGHFDGGGGVAAFVDEGEIGIELLGVEGGGLRLPGRGDDGDLAHLRRGFGEVPGKDGLANR